MAKGKGKKKAKGSSNVFSMFEQSQIQEFKEAFGMIDANRDGFIDKEDLRATYASLGVLSVDNDKVINALRNLLRTRNRARFNPSTIFAVYLIVNFFRCYRKFIQ